MVSIKTGRGQQHKNGNKTSYFLLEMKAQKPIYNTTQQKRSKGRRQPNGKFINSYKLHQGRLNSYQKGGLSIPQICLSVKGCNKRIIVVKHFYCVNCLTALIPGNYRI